MTKEQVIKLIEECDDLDLPTTMREAIWKDDLIEKIENFNENEEA